MASLIEVLLFYKNLVSDTKIRYAYDRVRFSVLTDRVFESGFCEINPCFGAVGILNGGGGAPTLIGM